MQTSNTSSIQTNSAVKSFLALEYFSSSNKKKKLSHSRFFLNSAYSLQEGLLNEACGDWSSVFAMQQMFPSLLVRLIKHISATAAATELMLLSW